jgi:hypothetical protein
MSRDMTTVTSREHHIVFYMLCKLIIMYQAND